MEYVLMVVVFVVVFGTLQLMGLLPDDDKEIKEEKDRDLLYNRASKLLDQLETKK